MSVWIVNRVPMGCLCTRANIFPRNTVDVPDPTHVYLHTHLVNSEKVVNTTIIRITPLSLLKYDFNVALTIKTKNIFYFYFVQNIYMDRKITIPTTRDHLPWCIPMVYQRGQKLYFCSSTTYFVLQNEVSCCSK